MDEIYFESSDGVSYIESLISGRYALYKTSSVNLDISNKLNKLIELELDLAIEGSKKALQTAKQESAKDNVRPIK